jgi:hypothetical protein
MPSPDLSRERDEILRSFSKGTQLTRDVLQAYENLQSKVASLQKENNELRAMVEADDSMRALIRKIEGLEKDKNELLSGMTRAQEAASAQPSAVELEAELSNFANLHVATNCLHSTLSPRGVARRIREVLEQLVGVEAYVIYHCAPGTSQLTPIAAHGLRPEEDPHVISERLVEVVSTGVSSILDESNPSEGTLAAAPAIVPLAIDDNIVGALLVVRSLAHKTQLSTVDFELFKLLGQHAAAALMAAGLYAQAGRLMPKAEAFDSLQH